MNIGYFILAFIAYYAIQILIGEKLASAKSKNQEQIETIHQAIPFYLALLHTGILAPLFEEVIFRFYLQDLIGGNGWWGILLASLLFALLHLVAGFSLAAGLSYMGVSMVLGLLYQWTGGLLFSAALLILVNSLAVVMMYYGDHFADHFKEQD